LLFFSTDKETFHPRHNLRITCKLSFSDDDINFIHDTLECVSKIVLASDNMINLFPFNIFKNEKNPQLCYYKLYNNR